MRILSVVGARPRFVELAPVGLAMRGRADHLIAHTGQHYDHDMSDVFFAALPAAVERPRPADTDASPYGTGQAAENTVRTLLER